MKLHAETSTAEWTVRVKSRLVTRPGTGEGQPPIELAKNWSVTVHDGKNFVTNRPIDVPVDVAETGKPVSIGVGPVQLRFKPELAPPKKGNRDGKPIRLRTGLVILEVWVRHNSGITVKVVDLDAPEGEQVVEKGDYMCPGLIRFARIEFVELPDPAGKTKQAGLALGEGSVTVSVAQMRPALRDQISQEVIFLPENPKSGQELKGFGTCFRIFDEGRNWCVRWTGNAVRHHTEVVFIGNQGKELRSLRWKPQAAGNQVRAPQPALQPVGS